MPKLHGSGNHNGNGNGGTPEPPSVPGDFIEPKCLACTSEYRKLIDKLIALATKYVEIQRITGVPRRSISNHANSHLGYEAAAVREIIQREAQAAEENIEEGMSGVLNRRVVLEVWVQQTFQKLVNGEMELTGKDAMTAIQMLNDFDTRTQGDQLDSYRLQFNAFVQAIRECAGPELWNDIRERTNEILAVEEPPKLKP